ncbi:hypothetical protein NDU88_000669 [Pleurodeles waltl]|uniref:Uncharacterized protein n=1 Tax=Pleurodeles waltl TaxID=8319 RepID=A0AAV7UR59_PLEWA|nr:hypothetical protein NDU88_000669 [Pleurodeles waltl]
MSSGLDNKHTFIVGRGKNCSALYLIQGHGDRSSLLLGCAVLTCDQSRRGGVDVRVWRLCGDGARLRGTGAGVVAAHRSAQGVAASVLACSLPSSPARGVQVRSSGRVVGRGRGREKVSGAGRTTIKAAGLRRHVGGFPHAQKGGAGAVKARSLKKKEKRRLITVGQAATSAAGTKSELKDNAESSSEDGR